MHLWQGKGYIGLIIIAELYKFLNHTRIIQVSETSGTEFAPGFDTRIIIQVVIRTKPVLVQQQVYLPAAGTTEILIVSTDIFFADFSAMIAGRRYDVCCFYKSYFSLKIEPPRKNTRRLD